MRINAVMPRQVQTQNLTRQNSIQKKQIEVNTSASNNVARILNVTFTGNAKNMNQIASAAPENKALGIPEYNIGGLAVVQQEGPESMHADEGLDIRRFNPYVCYNNEKGGYKLLIHPPKSEWVEGKLPQEIAEQYFYSAPPGQTLEDAAKILGKEPKELSYVIQSKPTASKEKDATGNVINKSKYIHLEEILLDKKPLEKAAINNTPIEKIPLEGSVEGIAGFDKIKNIKYKLFKAVDGTTPLTEYFLHTEDMAKASQAYSYDKWGNGGFEADLVGSDWCRALADVMPKMNRPELGDYNPGSYWLHDRPMFPFLNHIATESAAGKTYWNGIVSMSTFHNPGEAYQGKVQDPTKFFKVVASVDDVKELRKNPIFELLKEIDNKGWDTITDFDRNLAKKVLDPLLNGFLDDNGSYSPVMIAINGTKRNPLNMKAGTVSMNYGKEMRDPTMYSIANGLTHQFQLIKTHDITNGSTPANLFIDDPTANFGRGGNLLTIEKAGFTTYKYTEDNLAEVVTAKQKNTKWLVDMVATESAKGQDSLNKVFFTEAQIKEGRSVFGSLSSYKDGDILMMGWGRPDPQKGYPTTFEAFLEFLKSDAPEELKNKTKLIVGAGDKPWDADARDFKKIKEILKQIEELDGGKYKGQACYVDGMFPNRLVGCATYTLLTSVFEPCGITPLESFSAGTPVISTRTGGAPDFINKMRGFLTKSAYLRNPDAIGKSWSDGFETIDDARRAASAAELKDCILSAVKLHSETPKNYEAMVLDAITQPIEWSKNASFNNGVTANKRYRNEVWEIDKGWEARNKNPLHRLVGEFKAKVETVKAKAEEIVTQKSGSKAGKIVAISALSILALGGGGYYAYTKNWFKKKEESAEKPPFAKIG